MGKSLSKSLSIRIRLEKADLPHLRMLVICIGTQDNRCGECAENEDHQFVRDQEGREKDRFRSENELYPKIRVHGQRQRASKQRLASSVLPANWKQVRSPAIPPSEG